jgi:hypothetical protein
MNISIAFNFVSPKFSTKQQALSRINEVLNDLISSIVYGDSLESILIGLIAIEPIYNKFAIPRRPRYTEHKETMAFGSIPIVIHKTLEIEIKLDYEQVLIADDDALCKIVATKVLNTLRSLKLPKKVTDFDKDKFVTDVESVFLSEHYI